MIIWGEWEKIANGNEDLDFSLRIAGYRAVISWRADFMSWDVFYATSENEIAKGGYHADSNVLYALHPDLDEMSASDVVDIVLSHGMYSRAKSEAEAAIFELIKKADALVSSRY